MHVERETPALTLSKPAGDPLISTVGEVSPHWISAAGDVLEHPGPEEDDGSSDGIEFTFVVGDPELGPDITVADDIFSDGRIRPVYPVFNRRVDLLLDSSSKAVRLPVLIEDQEACSVSTSSSTGIVAENSPVPYCVWTPRSVPSSPDRCKKSSSTGTATRPWRLRDVFDGRSHSDGKDKFVFLAPPEKEKEKRPDPRASPSREAAAKGKGTAKGNGKVTEMDMVTAHRLYYAKGGTGGVGGGGGGARRSFLPYKRNLVGFFFNANPF